MNPPPRFRLLAAFLLLALAGGEGATIVSGTPATDAQATFSTAGPDILFFYMPDYLGDAPETVCTVYPTVSRVPLHRFYILDENGNRPTNLPDDAAALAAINKIWRQAGMEFYWAGATDVAGHPLYFDLDETEDGLDTFCMSLPAASGIRICFVNSIRSRDNTTAAFTISEGNGLSCGIFIPASCPSQTLAHEIGHACGLEDLYLTDQPPAGNPLPVFALPMTADDSPLDTTGATFYANGFPKGTFVTSLLMCGNGYSPARGDISRGRVFAADVTGSTNLLRCGLSSLTRTPSSVQDD